MEQMIPGFLEEMLKKQYGEEVFAKILAGYQARRPVTLRVNSLKAGPEHGRTGTYRCRDRV